MMIPKKIDLHMHSTVSDGSNTPEELLDCVRQAGLELFALTDHDAYKGSLQMIGLPAPATENYSNAGVTLSPGQENVFPTYFSSQIMKKVFEYDANGPIVNITQRDMSITLSDYTGLNTNQLKLLSALIVSVFLAIPYWKANHSAKHPHKGGQAHA